LNFKILQNGIVKGGSASYSLDPVLGIITYHCVVCVGALFISKSYTFQGSYKIDPSILQSSGLQIGKTITIGNLALTVISIQGTEATVSCAVIGQDAKGTASLDCSQQYVSLNTLDSTLNLYGFNLDIGVRRLDA
jgi:hypothetical protein